MAGTFDKAVERGLLPPKASLSGVGGAYWNPAKERQEGPENPYDMVHKVGSIPYKTTPSSSATGGEVRVVDPVSGGMKGSKLARFDMIPSDVLWELSEHYGKGEEKYPSDGDGRANWQRGYNWRLSVAAMQRHLHQFIMGEDFDNETGSSHLIALIWHAMALRWFQLHGKGTDYRQSMR